MANATENNYILEVFDTRNQKYEYILTNGEDDFCVIKYPTIRVLLLMDIFISKFLPSSTLIIRQKIYLDPKIRHDVFRSCL